MANVEVLAIGGGGGGGSNRGGGGGAGGYKYNASLSVTNTAYTVTVGAGGAAGLNGGDSTFDTVTGTGGGDGAETFANGGAGGSGGGGNLTGAGGAGDGGGEGSNGGNGVSQTNAYNGSGGGGGGAGATGTTGNATTGGNGGNGTANSISGTSVTYAGGGGGAGGSYQAGVAGTGGTGGTGGGANAPSYNGSTFIDGTYAEDGKGGGGAGRGNVGPDYRPGGDGVVIVRYATADFGTCTGGTITTDGSDTIHTFTSSGTLTFVAPTIEDVANSSLATNLVSYWELEEASGTRYDLTATGNDLADNNTVGSATGIQGNAADFEVSNSEYLSTATNPGPTGDFSISMYVKLETTGVAYHPIYSTDGSNSGFGLRKEASGQLFFQWGSGSTVVKVRTSSNLLTTTNWYHIVLTVDVSEGASGTKIYVDGTSESFSTLTNTATSLTGVNNLTIGGVATTASWDGLIDEVGIWSRALTSGEISALYNSGSGIPYEAGGATPTRNAIFAFGGM